MLFYLTITLLKLNKIIQKGRVDNVMSFSLNTLLWKLYDFKTQICVSDTTLQKNCWEKSFFIAKN